jgi:hypothetical protein
MILVIGIMLLAVAASGSDETSCPAHKAQEQGLTPFGAFHEVMAPAWHKAWPDKDFAALFAAGPQFQERFKAIAELQLASGNPELLKAFAAHREAFGQLVAKYAEAAVRMDSAAVYEIMPNLHDEFELSASHAMPIAYKEVDGMRITVGIIHSTHLPNKNTTGLVGSAETLVAQAGALTLESLPAPLVAHKDSILAAFTAIKTTVSQLKACCDKNDWDGYTSHAAVLQEALKAFSAAYL